jgi:polysaccharide biosynthesis PFTS motif protein
LALECSNIYIIFKEKKDRSIHYLLDPILGPKLLKIYEKMSSHPRITMCSNQDDPSEIISVSDMVISFPFTSTTFEALSINRPAIWHDPLGCYKDMLYDRTEGVVSHSYEELKTKVLEIKNMKPNEYRNPIPLGSPLLDPYRDGKAIERFRELLTLS